MFNPFDALKSPGNSIAIHNVKLIDVQQAEGGHELLTVEHAGTTHDLVGAGPWNAEYSRRCVGKFGYVVPAHSFGRELAAGACYFRDYIDQSLRRVPELDGSDRAASDDGRAQNVIGWLCDASPQGFRAPVGLIPGEHGSFVRDETVAVTLRVPPEFVRECHRVQLTPEELLRSFVGDVAGIHNMVVRPRADDYCSNGSSERDHAEGWLERAHGMNAIDLDAEEFRREQEEEKQFLRDDFASLLDDYEHHGGNAEELLAAVQALVKKQASAGNVEND